MIQDITTRILHADRLAGTEHGAVLKPLHIAMSVGIESQSDLLADFAQAFARLESK